jgi:F-box only protein 30
VETNSLSRPSTVSDDDSDSSPWQINKFPPGLQSSVCAKLNGITLKGHELSKAIKPCDILNEIKENINSNLIPSPPALPNCTPFSLDINLDSLQPSQPKPKLMYTFRCAQEFRRDEYRSHYKNVHGDIHGSIDGWMEHRCPLWRYGCNYVQRRIHPFPIGTKIIFNPIIESFGHAMTTNCDQNESNPMNLSSLPYEVSKKSIFDRF